MLMRISYKDVDFLTDHKKALEDLEFDYCLPKCFWSDSEWCDYVRKRIDIMNKIREYKESYNEQEYLCSIDRGA